MTNIQSSGPSVGSFRALAETSEAVVLKGGDLKATSATPAKQGFLGSAVQWIKTLLGAGPHKANEQTRAAFTAALTQNYGQGISEAALHQVKTQQDNDKPLNSRDIKAVLDRADQLMSLRNDAAQCKLALIEASAKRDMKLFTLEMKAEAKGISVPKLMKLSIGSEAFLAQQRADEAQQKFKAELFKKD